MAEVANPYYALMAGDVDGALGWYEKRRQGVMNQPMHMYNWARLLCDLDRRAEAAPLFDPLAEIEDYAMFVAGQRLIERLEEGMSKDQALEVTPLGAAARHKAAIAAALAEFDIVRRPPEVRHIAICGVSFCGSTLMDMLLEGLPGVASIGESVWLTLSYINERPAARDYSDPHGKGVQACNYCGRECEYLTPNFRTALGLNPIDWYFKIAERLGTKILVSADKNLPKIILADPRLRLQGLVVFKSPKQAWASNYTKMAKDLTPEAYFDAMVKYMAVWRSAYGELANTFNPAGGKIFLDFDRFADSPEAELRSLSRILDLEYDPEVFAKASPGHSIGGNSNAIRGVHKSDFRVNVRSLGEPAIPADHAAWIDSQQDLTDLHQTLRRLSADDFAQVA